MISMLAHLEGEDHRRLAVLHRGGAGDVQRERRLAATGPAGHRDHLPGVQAVGVLVQLGEAGRDAGADAARRADLVDLVERGLQQRLDVDVVLGRAPLGDLVDLGLRAVDHVVDGAGDVGRRPGRRLVAHLDDPGAGDDQPPQRRPLGDDLGVVAGVGRGRDERDQRVQVRRAADAHQLPVAGQLGRHRHRVGRLAAPVQVEDRVVDELVRRPVEVARADDLDDVGDRVLGQHHRAEHRLLGLDRLRRGAVELARPVAPPGPGTRLIRQRHGRRRPPVLGPIVHIARVNREGPTISCATACRARRAARDGRAAATRATLCRLPTSGQFALCDTPVHEPVGIAAACAQAVHSACDCAAASAAATTRSRGRSVDGVWTKKSGRPGHAKPAPPERWRGLGR